MRIAICDDCISDGKQIYEIIVSHPELSTCQIDVYDSSIKLLDSFKLNNFYDIVFLDVDMPNINGIELGKSIRSKSSKTFIVFVTSYSQYAIEAYECEAFNYLLKPLELNKAISVINKLIVKYREQNKFHTIKVKSDLIRIAIQDIFFVECCRKHIFYHMENSFYDTIENLSDVYNALKDYGFQQIHQGYIVNMEKIQRFDKNSVILSNGDTVPVSVRKRKEVLDTYRKYVEVHI